MALSERKFGLGGSGSHYLTEVEGDLTDSTLSTEEGGIVVRVGLPEAASASDTIQLYLTYDNSGTTASTTFDSNGGTAGTAHTITSSDVALGFVDIAVAAGDIPAGAVGFSAKITSGSIESNDSIGLFFTNSQDGTPPTATASIASIK